MSIIQPILAGFPDMGRSQDCLDCKTTRPSKCFGSGINPKAQSSSYQCHLHSDPGFAQRCQHLVFKVPQQVSREKNQDGRPQSRHVQGSGNIHRQPLLYWWDPSLILFQGPFSNSPDFANDFVCPLGTAMNPVKKCKVWWFWIRWVMLTFWWLPSPIQNIWH